MNGTMGNSQATMDTGVHACGDYESKGWIETGKAGSDGKGPSMGAEERKVFPHIRKKGAQPEGTTTNVVMTNLRKTGTILQAARGGGAQRFPSVIDLQ